MEYFNECLFLRLLSCWGERMWYPTRPSQSVRRGALGMMISCLSPELNSKYFFPFLGTNWEESCAASRREQSLSACSCISWTGCPKHGAAFLASPRLAGRASRGTGRARGEPAPVSTDPPGWEQAEDTQPSHCANRRASLLALELFSLPRGKCPSTCYI